MNESLGPDTSTFWIPLRVVPIRYSPGLVITSLKFGPGAHARMHSNTHVNTTKPDIKCMAAVSETSQSKNHIKDYKCTRHASHCKFKHKRLMIVTGGHSGRKFFVWCSWSSSSCTPLLSASSEPNISSVWMTYLQPNIIHRTTWGRERGESESHN